MKRWIVIGILAILCVGLYFIWAGTSDELELTTANLASTQTQLASVQTEVETTQAELATTQTELATTQTELATTQTELATTQTQLEGIKDELTELKVELVDLQTSYEGLMTGHGYTIKDPTYREMMNFIRLDKTDQKRYIEGEYVCENFAADVCNVAEVKGIRCAYVTIRYPNELGHAIIAFNTIDEGIVYIEPQSDDLVEPEVGEYFYKCVVPRAGYYYERPDYDDTIERILVVW
jgi:hypothetical protein